MKRALLCALALVLAATAASAKPKNIAIGVEYVLTFGSGGALSGFAVTGSPPVLPVVFGVAMRFGPGYLNLGVTGDWWFYQRGITGPLALYAGPGLFFGADLGGTGVVQFGARGVVGLEIFPIDILELFVEAAINVGLSISGGGGSLFWGVPLSLGARLWF